MNYKQNGKPTRKMTRKELTSALEAFQKAAEHGCTPEFIEISDKYSSTKAIIELPLGELLNPDIAGYVWAWNLKHCIEHVRLDNHDLAAQGIEGFVHVHTTLTTAVLVRDWISPCRMNVYIYEGK